jgi:U3 small nucleolar RNA-associated protein 13
MIGFNDEIVDAAFLSPDSSKPESHLALATNSSLIRVYTGDGVDARLLHGHTDIVLCLDKAKNGLLASGSKDKSARVWAPVAEENDGGWGCVAVCEGHAESIGAIALSRSDGGRKFMCTGSQDRTIKMWDLSNVPSKSSSGQEVVKCKSLTTHKAHDKDINALDISPDDHFLASGSQDRTAKIYALSLSSGSLKELGVCKGHRRGVWSVRFSRSERVLVTGSGDKTVKMWNMNDFSCLRTFEGHTNSVLRVETLSAGRQVVSCASDGLVKLWDVKEEECTATMDNHEDKVGVFALIFDFLLTPA